MFGVVFFFLSILLIAVLQMYGSRCEREEDERKNNNKKFNEKFDNDDCL